MHTTNAARLFVTVAADTRATTASTPPPRDPPSVAARCHTMIAEAPYTHTSDDVLFTVYADRAAIPDAERLVARAAFFSKGQPCFRASPLTKQYGWGVHHDADGRIALVPMESAAYAQLASGTGPDGAPVTVVRAMAARR